MVDKLLSTKIVLTCVSAIGPGYDKIRRTIDAHALIGHKTVSPEQCIVIVLYRSLLFRNSNMMDTVVASARD